MAVVGLYWGCLRGGWSHVMINNHVMLMWQWAPNVLIGFRLCFHFVYLFKLCITRVQSNLWTYYPLTKKHEFFVNCKREYRCLLYVVCWKIPTLFKTTLRPELWNLPLYRQLAQLWFALGRAAVPLETLSISRRTKASLGNWVTEPVICK